MMMPFRASAWTALLLLAALTVSAESDAELPAGADYGAGLTLEVITPLNEVVAHPDTYADRTLLVKGRIRDVCQRKGCWMVVTEGDSRMTVRFADYGFFVPKESSGKDAYVEGTVAVTEISEDEARHYEEESAHGDPSKIQGPQRVVSFTATGVRLVPAE